MSTPTLRLKNAAVALLASSGLVLTGCNNIEAGGQPLPPSPLPSTQTPSSTPTSTPTKNAAQVAAEDKVLLFYKKQWAVLSGKSRDTSAVVDLLRNQSGGTTGFQQQQLKYLNTVIGQEWVLKGSRPVQIVSSRQAKKVKGRAQVLVNVCEDDTQWRAIDRHGKPVKITMPKAPYALTLSVQKWPDGKWYVTRSESRNGTCK